MLQLSKEANVWRGPKLELNISFDALREYQWKRLIDAFWQYPHVSGPYQARFHPHDLPQLHPIDIRYPDPTATLIQFGAYQLQADLQVGFELLTTRSLFECISLIIPLGMFADAVPQRDDDDIAAIIDHYLNIALTLYDTVTYDIACMGFDRGCDLLLELVSDRAARERFLKRGDFLVRDDALAALHVSPRQYEEVKPRLRWGPPSA